MPFRCECKLADCAYYLAVADAPTQCDCQHTDKTFYPKNPCPLYRKDWNRKDNQAEALKARLFKRKT